MVFKIRSVDELKIYAATMIAERNHRKIRQSIYRMKNPKKGSFGFGYPDLIGLLLAAGLCLF